MDMVDSPAEWSVAEWSPARSGGRRKNRVNVSRFWTSNLWPRLKVLLFNSLDKTRKVVFPDGGQGADFANVALGAGRRWRNPRGSSLSGFGRKEREAFQLHWPGAADQKDSLAGGAGEGLERRRGQVGNLIPGYYLLRRG